MILRFGEYLEQICTAMKAASDHKLTVKVGEAEIFLEDAQPSITAPAAFVVFLGGKPVPEASGQELVELKLAVYLFVKQAQSVGKRASNTHDMAQWLWLLIEGNCWGNANLQPAKIENLENLTNAAVSKKGLMCFCLVFSEVGLFAPADAEIVGPSLQHLFAEGEEI